MPPRGFIEKENNLKTTYGLGSSLDLIVAYFSLHFQLSVCL